ncbi:hypothetical protein E4H12_10930 [Candidatus Thorarchaeota archaeon]|nr:MAG: hypothetical protein E4H12_10930 [Candidatus Thorarchaeota archaeon]
MSDERISKIKFIDKDRRRIEVILGGLSVEFPLNAIPDLVYEAMADAVNRSTESPDTLNELYIDTLMKPTVSSLNASNIFPINSAKKIIRLTLTDDALADSVHDLEGAELAFQGRPFEDTIDERIELYQKMMLDDKKIDRFRFGAVEMYGDRTYHNILRDPRITLNMFWVQDKAPQAQSYQINCIAEIVPPGDPFFKYMRLMRRLFSKTLIDLRGTSDYVCAYKFWVCETKDKSLAEKTDFVPT